MMYMVGLRVIFILLSIPDITFIGADCYEGLRLKPQIDKLAIELAGFHDWFYLGRNALYPIALEGALKITEVSYVHAQGIPTGEMKHGAIALVNKDHISVLLLPEDELLYEKGLSALEELKARHGRVLTIIPAPNQKAVITTCKLPT